MNSGDYDPGRRLRVSVDTAIEIVDLPQSPDNNGCTAAQYSYAFSKLGIQMTPEGVDTMTGRRPNDYFRYEYEKNLLKLEMDLGCSVEQVYPTSTGDTDSFDSYLNMDSEIAYQRYCDKNVGVYGAECLEWPGMAKDEFLKNLNVRKEITQLELIHEKSGQLRTTYMDITPELLTEKMKKQVALCSVINPNEKGTLHDVVLEEVRPAGDMLSVRCFYPMFGRPSVMATLRAHSLGDLISLDGGITFLSRFEGKPAEE